MQFYRALESTNESRHMSITYTVCGPVAAVCVCVMTYTVCGPVVAGLVACEPLDQGSESTQC